jgi:hypothetical protein
MFSRARRQSACATKILPEPIFPQPLQLAGVGMNNTENAQAEACATKTCSIQTYRIVKRKFLAKKFSLL